MQARFGVGSSSVREALGQLAADDLVIALEHRGFRIAEASLEDFAAEFHSSDPNFVSKSPEPPLEVRGRGTKITFRGKDSSFPHP